MNSTPLRRWLRANAKNPRSTKPGSIAGLARALKVTRSRAQFWVKRESLPTNHMLERLLDLTGLPLAQLLPDETILRRKRLRAARRRAELKTNPKRGKATRTTRTRPRRGKVKRNGRTGRSAHARQRR